MSTTPAQMVGISGAEAVYLLGGAVLGRLVYERRGVTFVRPAAHVLEFGRLVVRTPVQADVFAERTTLTYHTDEIDAVSGTGWSVTASGPAAVITDPDEAAHYRRTLHGWAHGPHDVLVRIDPHSVDGHRLVPAEVPTRISPS
ncbi:MAG TPA: pyridoxamine 5'-phosphate oxidase family protein [Streptomyces sp.]|nr:pyridoxamine 5'-phosphate oxidase family protein [Streptomyces sp.]